MAKLSMIRGVLSPLTCFENARKKEINSLCEFLMNLRCVDLVGMGAVQTWSQLSHPQRFFDVNGKD